MFQILHTYALSETTTRHQTCKPSVEQIKIVQVARVDLSYVSKKLNPTANEMLKRRRCWVRGLILSSPRQLKG